jgi:SNF2 family DNA or RNA helicase
MEFVKRSWFDGDYADFDERYVVRNGFGGVIHYKRLPEMHELLSKWMIRKTQLDEDVRDHLPERLPRDPVLVPADPSTKKLYNHIASDLLERLKEASELLGPTFSVAEHYGEEESFDPVANEIKGQLMSRISALRMLACHPQLLLDSAQKFADGDGEGSAYVHGLWKDGHLDKLAKAPKLDASLKYLVDHLDIDPSYKAVVFSSYLGGVEHVSRVLEGKGYQPVAYTGELSAKQKEARKVAFQTDPDIRVLVSSDAGGYGVNLPQANLLLNYDQPWTSGMRLQRNSRIIRASSEWKSVVVQDILLQGSLEERQYAMLNQKGAVSSAILDGTGVNSAGGVDLTVGSLIGFLQTRKM